MLRRVFGWLGLAVILALAPLCAASYMWWLNQQGVVTEFSDLSSAGLFGDSFGVLNALFSGLAFSGVIITILLQRRELQLQREELHETRLELQNSSKAQHRAARLAALNTLLAEYKAQIDVLKDALSATVVDVDRRQWSQDIAELQRKKKWIVTELETVFSEHRLKKQILEQQYRDHDDISDVVGDPRPSKNGHAAGSRNTKAKRV